MEAVGAVGGDGGTRDRRQRAKSGSKRKKPQERQVGEGAWKGLENRKREGTVP